MYAGGQKHNQCVETSASMIEGLIKQEELIEKRLEDMSNNMQSIKDTLKKREELTEKRLEDMCKMMQNLRLNR